MMERMTIAKIERTVLLKGQQRAHIERSGD